MHGSARCSRRTQARSLFPLRIDECCWRGWGRCERRRSCGVGVTCSRTPPRPQSTRAEAELQRQVDGLAARVRTLSLERDRSQAQLAGATRLLGKVRAQAEESAALHAAESRVAREQLVAALNRRGRDDRITQLQEVANQMVAAISARDATARERDRQVADLRQIVETLQQRLLEEQQQRAAAVEDVQREQRRLRRREAQHERQRAELLALLKQREQEVESLARQVAELRASTHDTE